MAGGEEMAEGGGAEDGYVLGRSAGETQRLITQARFWDLPLRRLFEDVIPFLNSE